MGWNVEIPDAESYVLGDPGIESVIREIRAAKLAGIDTETTGLNVMRAMPVFWSLAVNNRRICMPSETLPLFREVFADESIDWVLHNAKFDAHMLANVGITLRGRWFDTAVMHALLYEEESHRLKDLAKKKLGWGWASFKDTFNISDESRTGEVLLATWATDRQRVVEYAANDAFGTLSLFHVLRRELEEEAIFSLYPDEYPNMWQLYTKTELPYTKVLWTCERNGIRVNTDYLKDIELPVQRELLSIHKEIVRTVGFDLNPRSHVHVRELCLNKLGLRPRRMTKGGKSGVKTPSVDAEFLEEHDDIDIIKLILRYRDLDKLLGTYVLGLPDKLGPDGRIHPRFNQDVARCMPAGELVLTNRGYIPVEHVVVGDLVLSHMGVPRPVTETSQHAPQPVYRVRLSNGCTLRTTGNHPYHTLQGWVRADKLSVGADVTVHSDAEAWRDVPGWEDFQVSSWGRVLNKKTGRILTQYTKDRWGHLKVTLYRNGAQKRGTDKKDLSVHRLVRLAFAGQPPVDRPEVRHLNGIAWDNTVGNLSWGSSHENRQDARRHGTMSHRRAGRTLLSAETVGVLRETARRPSTSPTAKLNYEIAETIRAEGLTPQQTATRYDVSYAAAWNIIRGKTYRHPERQHSPTAKELASQLGVSAGHVRAVQAGTSWEDEGHIEGSRAVFGTARIVSIDVLPEEATYGLTVAVDHSHVTGGIVTHNTGRLSSSDPNCQNIPNADNDRHKVRRAFEAEKGNALIVADYSALEMRLLAVAAGEQDMIQIFLDGKDIHMGNASLVFGLPYEDIVKAKKLDKAIKEEEEKVKRGATRETLTRLTGEMEGHYHDCLLARGYAKTIGFGLNYGMKANKLARGIGKSVEEAQLLMERYPAVRHFYDSAIAETKESLKSFTILGRRRFLPEITSMNSLDRWGAERKAVNNQIQGSAADLVRLAMLNAHASDLYDQHDCHMLMQVHDELVFECPESEVDICMQKIKNIMEHPFPTELSVPFEISIGKGSNWLDAK